MTHGPHLHFRAEVPVLQAAGSVACRQHTAKYFPRNCLGGRGPPHPSVTCIPRLVGVGHKGSVPSSYLGKLQRAIPPAKPPVRSAEASAVSLPLAGPVSLAPLWVLPLGEPPACKSPLQSLGPRESD